MLFRSARKKIVQGSTSAGKTYGIIPILIDKAAKIPKLKITVVNESIPASKDGPVDIFKTVMQDTNRWNDSGWVGNPMEYTFVNKSRIQFKSFDTVGKAKAAGKRDILFVNEGNHMPYSIVDALMIRSKETWIDYNPDAEFYAHTEILQEPNSELLILTYLDNEALPPETLEDLLIKKGKAFHNPNLTGAKLLAENNIKNNYWCNWWKVYGLGLIGSLQGVVLSDWSQIDTIPEEAEYVGSGMDFGYSADPTTLIDVYKYNNQYIFDEQIYKTGLLNSQIASLCTPIERTDTGKTYTVKRNIYADSAEPKSIDEIARYGIAIRGADKGRDSISYGLDLLQQEPFLVTSNSLNLIKELRGYVWDTDKTGKQLNKPIDSMNHCIDAMRYWAIMRMGKSRKIDLGGRKTDIR